MIVRTIRILSILLISMSVLQGQNIDYAQFNSQYEALLQNYVREGKVNYSALKQDSNFPTLVNFTETFVPSALEVNDLKAYRINVYNIHVIHGIIQHFPVNSVQDITGFFDRVKRTIEGKSITLNDYEKKSILREFEDPRMHFVLVCGAVACPPIINKAYTGKNIEEQLERQTTLALRNEDFIQVTDNDVKISQIFQWYTSDFGGNNTSVLAFINSYREDPLPSKNFSFYSYDWTLNGNNSSKISDNSTDNSANRYVVSATIPRGSWELKIFNNLYSQEVDNFRSNFFTTTFSALYGLTRNFNIGLTGRYRIVSNHAGESSPFNVFGGGDPVSSRNGLTGLGPIIRYAPVPKWENFSIQSSFTFSTGKKLEGTNEKPYIDYQGGIFITQFFNDFTLSSKFSLFTEFDVILEGIGLPKEDFAYRFSTPVTAIFSYFPTPQSTIYVLGGYSPYWESPYDFFYQSGIGGKYQITSQFEIELLYNRFRNKFVLEKNGNAQTFNFGLRYTL